MNPPKMKVDDVMIIEVMALPDECAQTLPNHVDSLRRNLLHSLASAGSVDIERALARHPLYSRVVGFAASRLRRDGRNVRMRSCWADAIDEFDVLELARQRLDAHRRITTVGFSDGDMPMNLLTSRMWLTKAPPWRSPRVRLARHVELAELISCGGLHHLPIRNQVMDLLRIPVRRNRMSLAAVRDACASGDKDALLDELCLRVQETAQIFARLCYHPEADVTGKIIESDSGSDVARVPADVFTGAGI